MARVASKAFTCMLLFIFLSCLILLPQYEWMSKQYFSQAKRDQRSLNGAFYSDNISVLIRTTFSKSAEQLTKVEKTENGIISKDCKTILSGDIDGITKMRSSGSFPWRDLTSDTGLKVIVSDCSELKRRYRFPSFFTANVTQEEIDFPIAYSILAHQNINQLLMLISAIYREHNVYCVHLDAKASSESYEALLAVTKCFPNVFMSKVRENVIYAHVSRLLADIACMRDLLDIGKEAYNWRYLINLCAQDFPSRTNLEIVQQLKKFRGFNSIGGYASISEQIRERTKFVHQIVNTTKDGEIVQKISKTKVEHRPPPYNMTVVKNLAYNFYTREFLQWALVDGEVGQALLEWSMDTYSPDEHFWLMLHRYPGAPGGSTLTSGYQLARRIMWATTNLEDSCHGEWRHLVCVLGAEDVYEASRGRSLFINKFDVTLDSTGPICLRQQLDERVLLPNSLRTFDNADREPNSPPKSFFQKPESLAKP